MYNGLTLFKEASALARHASARQSVIARNIANADTPGYGAQDLKAFADVYESGDARTDLRTTRPGHLADPLQPGAARLISEESSGNASPNGNGVSIETEMMKATEARQQHDLALSVYRSGMDLLRAGLGKTR